jgi:hypothetical protein
MGFVFIIFKYRNQAGTWMITNLLGQGKFNEM